MAYKVPTSHLLRVKKLRKYDQEDFTAKRASINSLRGLPEILPLKEIALPSDVFPLIREKLEKDFTLVSIFSENQESKSIFEFDDLNKFVNKFNYDPAWDSVCGSFLKNPEKMINNHYDYFKNLKKSEIFLEVYRKIANPMIDRRYVHYGQYVRN